MAKTTEEIVTEAERAVNRVLNNNIPPETCPEKKAKAKYKREKVVQGLAAKLVPLSTAGPTQIK